MSKTPIPKADFYTKLIELVSQSQKSVHFYSISCCFGFYSLGLKNFESVYLALKESLSKRKAGKYLDIQVLVKADKDNPIDTYALDRLGYLENQFKLTSNDEKSRIVFKELELYGEAKENVQFVIVDGDKILVSKIQDESFNVELDLVLNKSESGVIFSKEDFPVEFAEYETLFKEKWQQSTQLDIEVKSISRRRLKYLLDKFKPYGTEKNERDIQLVLAGYLQGRIAIGLQLESPIGGSRIDITIGHGRMNEKHGIEIKYGSDNNSIKEIMGQMELYHKQFDNLFLLICKPMYNAESKSHLKTFLSQRDIILIET